jgi:hypothetical protein
MSDAVAWFIWAALSFVLLVAYLMSLDFGASRHTKRILVVAFLAWVAPVAIRAWFMVLAA